MSMYCKYCPAIIEDDSSSVCSSCAEERVSTLSAGVPWWSVLLENTFKMETDNGTGPLFIFKVLPDGTRTIAAVSDVRDFVLGVLHQTEESLRETRFNLSIEKAARKRAEDNCDRLAEECFHLLEERRELRKQICDLRSGK